MVVGNANTTRPEIAMAAMTSCFCAITAPMIDLDIEKYRVLSYLRRSYEEVRIHLFPQKRVINQGWRASAGDLLLHSRKWNLRVVHYSKEGRCS